MPIKPIQHPVVQGFCPACNRHTLFLGTGGYVTCSYLGCKDPGAANKILLRMDELETEETPND